MTFLPDSPRKILVITWWIGSSYRGSSLSLYRVCSNSLSHSQQVIVKSTTVAITHSVMLSSMLISSSSFNCMTRNGYLV